MSDVVNFHKKISTCALHACDWRMAVPQKLRQSTQIYVIAHMYDADRSTRAVDHRHLDMCVPVILCTMTTKKVEHVQKKNCAVQLHVYKANHRINKESGYGMNLDNYNIP